MKKLSRTILSTVAAVSVLSSLGVPPNEVSASAQQIEDVQVQSTQLETGTYAIALKPGQLAKL